MAKAKPLNVRLRVEADEWSSDEPVYALLVEAATLIEELQIEVAELQAPRTAVQELAATAEVLPTLDPLPAPAPQLEPPAGAE